MGGAMNPVTGAERVVVVMKHGAKDGSAKLAQQCTPFATVRARVVGILAVIDVGDDGLVLRELAPGVSEQQVIDATGAPLTIALEAVDA
ncbi:hypothetical protein WDJ51_03945 [Rathayibacter sp. YIM 133350]|uniref:hypothetical protein n=1 Tax=Rathayibacter sp. YIM 133350 TaxID=3131992 RepID=UPI00307F0C33